MKQREDEGRKNWPQETKVQLAIIRTTNYRHFCVRFFIPVVPLICNVGWGTIIRGCLARCNYARSFISVSVARSFTDNVNELAADFIRECPRNCQSTADHTNHDWSILTTEQIGDRWFWNFITQIWLSFISGRCSSPLSVNCQKRMNFPATDCS